MKLPSTIIACIAVAAAGTAGAMPAPPIATDEIQSFVQAAGRRDTAALRAMFGARMVKAEPMLKSGRAPVEAFLASIAGCRYDPAMQFATDSEVFLQWSCPDRPWDGPSYEMAGVAVRLWRRPEGLAFAFAEQGVTRPGSPLLAPPTR
jgi:hypothetical protein